MSFKRLSIYEAFAVFFAGAISAMAGYWVQDRTPPVEVRSSLATNTPVPPGGQLLVKYVVNRVRSCAVNIDRTVVDGGGVRYVLEDLNFAAAPGPIGADTFIAPVPIARNANRGYALYRVSARYECNAIHKLWPVVTLTETPFEINGPETPQPLSVEIVPR